MIPALRPQLPPNRSIVPPDQKRKATIQPRIIHFPAKPQTFTCSSSNQRNCVKEATSGSRYLFNRVKHKDTRAGDTYSLQAPIAKSARAILYPAQNREPECPEEEDYIIKGSRKKSSCLHPNTHQREKVLERLQGSPFFVKLLRDLSSDTSFSMERLPDNLYDSHIKLKNRMPHEEFKLFSYQIFLALSFMKKLGIIHADIKPENMTKKNGAKLFDFNLAQEENKKSTQPLLSSPFYRPPENVLEFETYTCAFDMWSFGCCLYELITLKPLFVYYDTNGRPRILFFY